MREHPIPQDITNYKFHLVGSMTLKQFAELVVGAIVALIFYQTNLPTIVKWIFIGSSVGLGFAVAFVPIEERPLDHWIITFFKKLYSPTKFYWKKASKIPGAFTYTTHKQSSKSEPQIELEPIRRKKVQEFLQSISYQNTGKDEWELAHEQKVSQVVSFFDQVDVEQTQIKSKQKNQKPSLKVRVRGMKSPSKENEKQIFSADQQVESAKPQQNTQVVTKSAPEPQKSQAKQTSNQQVSQTNPRHHQQAASQPASQVKTQQPPQAQQAVTNNQLPFPSPPTQPNKIVGMVLTPDNQLVEDAVIEIKNGQGQIVRAVKSNSLGQFFISSPLENGSYRLQTDKPDLKFQPIQLDLSGQVVAPLEIRSSQARD